MFLYFLVPAALLLGLLYSRQQGVAIAGWPALPPISPSTNVRSLVSFAPFQLVPGRKLSAYYISPSGIDAASARAALEAALRAPLTSLEVAKTNVPFDATGQRFADVWLVRWIGGPPGSAPVLVTQREVADARRLGEAADPTDYRLTMGLYRAAEQVGPERLLFVPIAGAVGEPA